MDYEEALADLDARIRWGTRPGLERIAALAEAMGHPQRSYPVIGVSGTNGKYSVAVMCASILEALGRRVGVYSSPHVEDVRERIAVAGAPIPPEGFGRTLEHLLPYVRMVEEERGDHLTYFETLTAMAFEWFFDQAVHAAVLETGLGGEYDATNVADAAVAVVVGVSRDHVEQFGDDLERAAWEKAGIAKEGSVVVSGVTDPEASFVVEERALERGASRVLRLERDVELTDHRLAVGGQMIGVRTPLADYGELFLNVHGTHQARNAALAVAACEAFVEEALDPEGVRDGLAAVEIPGRIEVVGRRPLVVLDGGHNPEAARAVCETLRGSFVHEGRICVVGMLGGKLVEEVLDIVAPEFERFVVTAPDDERAAEPERLVRALEESGVPPDRIEVVEGVPEALRSAEELAAPDDLVLVFGSFYTVGEARSWLRQEGLLPQAERASRPSRET